MEEAVFALKGGTAISLFEWDMPRLSVDIDLTYLPTLSIAVIHPGHRGAAVPANKAAVRRRGQFHQKPQFVHSQILDLLEHFDRIATVHLGSGKLWLSW